MRSRWRSWLILTLLPVHCVSAADKYDCIAAPKPPKLPFTRASGRDNSVSNVHVLYQSGYADTWKPTRKEIGSVPAGTAVKVLEDLIVIDAPDIVWVPRPIETMNLKQGDTILRYAQLGEGSADLWADGCWYKEASADFIIEPDGGGCGGSQCSAKVTKVGKQIWWFRVRLPNGKTGWMPSQSLDLSGGG